MKAIVLLAVAMTLTPSAATRLDGTQDHLWIVYRIDKSATTSTTFVNLPGANVMADVPEGTSAFLLARFVGNASSDCDFRTLVDGTVLPFVEDQPSGILGPGVHTVQVQFILNGPNRCVISNWSLRVERVTA